MIRRSAVLAGNNKQQLQLQQHKIPKTKLITVAVANGAVSKR